MSNDFNIDIEHLSPKEIKGIQMALKVVLNSTYGISNDETSNAYDPRQAHNICMNGQLMLIDLIEHLEPYIVLIQSNTDGLILMAKDDSLVDKVIEICHKWEKRTGMGLEIDEITEIFQRDVNNYCFKFSNGKIERKGAVTKELSPLDYDLAIVNKAVVDYLIDGTSVEDTINNCNSLKDFQKIVRLKSTYNYTWYNGEYSTDRTHRVFASSDKNDTGIYKCKVKDKREKFADTSEHVFVVDENVNDMTVPEKLNRNWYIRTAKQRLSDFGINLEESEMGLF